MRFFGRKARHFVPFLDFFYSFDRFVLNRCERTIDARVYESLFSSADDGVSVGEIQLG